jgi:hypothetical protein
MNKYLLFPLVFGNLLFGHDLAARGGNLIVRDAVPYTQTTWQETLSLPQYNPAEHFGEALTGVSITVNARARGTYTLVNTGSTLLRYGNPSSMVGADITISNPLLPSLSLDTLPIGSVGSGTLAAPPSPGRPPSCPMSQVPPCRLEAQITGVDTELQLVNSSDFDVFTGLGTIQFLAQAPPFTNVAVSGSHETETNMDAYLEIVVNYSFNDPPPPLEIPESYLGIVSLLTLGLGGWFLKSRQS